MEIQKRKIEELIPASYNPRKDLDVVDQEYLALKSSIERFGLVVPIIENKTTGNLVGGHQRLRILKDLGYTEVDVCIIELEEKKEKALNLALNRIKGDWDKKALANIAQEIRLAGIDLKTLGFSKGEIDTMFPPQMDASTLFDSGDNVFDADDEEIDHNADVVSMVGKYRFSMPRIELEEVMGDIRYRNGFVKEKVENEIKLRLLYGRDWAEHCASDDDAQNDGE